MHRLYDLTQSKNLKELFKNVVTLAELAPEECQDELMKKLQMDLIPPSKKSRANSLEPKADIYFGHILLMTIHMKDGWDLIEKYRDEENPDKVRRVRLAKTTQHEELSFYQENDGARIEFKPVTTYRGILMTPRREEAGYEDSQKAFAVDEVYSQGEYCQTTKPYWETEFRHFG